MDLQGTLTTIATSSVVTGFLVFGARTWFKAGLDNHYKKKIQDLTHEYDKKLSKFNAKIAKEAADRQEDFQRKIYDFTMYSAKKHELYPELFKQITEIHTDLQNLDKLSTANLLQDLPSQDKMMPFLKKLEKVLHSKALSGLVLDEDFIKALDATASFDLDTCVSLARVTILKGLSNEILKNIQSLDNLFASNLLYFSEDVTSYVKPILMGCYEILKEDFYSEEEMTKMRFSLSRNVDELRGILKKEISVGYYSS